LICIKQGEEVSQGEGNCGGITSESPIAVIEQVPDKGSSDSTEGFAYKDLSEEKESELVLTY